MNNNLDEAVELIVSVLDGNNLNVEETKKLNEAITLINGD